MCRKNNIPVRYTPSINSEEVIGWISDLAPDVIFCFGWSQLFKKKLLNIASLGVIGFHPALLPANRGRHPLIWSLILGLKETGSSFFFMDEGADSGDYYFSGTYLITGQSVSTPTDGIIESTFSATMTGALTRGTV